ncbi:MAG: class I SAM-dependent methyltransferase [Dehalococcoidia bacterium]
MIARKPRHSTASKQPKLYRELASWFHLLTAPKDYKAEAAFYRRLLVEACDRRPKTVLELGSGGGNNASHLKKHFELTLVDLSPEMLALSRTLNPECEHIVGDMRSVSLGHTFDAVFVHDAVSYITSENGLRRAIETAFVHCRPGGAALFSPDHLRETFRESTGHGGHDGEDGRGLRYVAWTWDPDPDDDTYLVDFAYLLRGRTGRVRTIYDRHVNGAFRRRTWLRLLRDAGFEAKIEKFDTGNMDIETQELFVAKRPN